MTDSVHRYHLFETVAGFAAIAWRGRGITGLRLPATAMREAERAVARRLPDAMPAEPPAWVARIVADARRYFAGVTVDFSDVPVDLGEQAPFFHSVYAHIRRLGRGETTTYGAVAKALGAGPEAARDVGQAMAGNPVPLIIPCHRVLGAGGKVGGFSAPGGSGAKVRMLALEGVHLADAAPPSPPAQESFGF